MNYNKIRTSVRKLARAALTQDDLAQRIIIQRGNKYTVYRDYKLEEIAAGWKVSSHKFSETLLFTTSKVALAWCILTTVRRYAAAAHMLHLDNLVSAKQGNIDILMNALEKPDGVPNRAILLARLTEDINSRQKYKKQIHFCVESAKYIKLIGTNDEFIRANKASRRKRSR